MLLGRGTCLALAGLLLLPPEWGRIRRLEMETVGGWCVVVLEVCAGQCVGGLGKEGAGSMGAAGSF